MDVVNGRILIADFESVSHQNLLELIAAASADAKRRAVAEDNFAFTTFVESQCPYALKIDDAGTMDAKKLLRVKLYFHLTQAFSQQV